MSRVLLLSNPRSGSTFLKDLLECHPEVTLLDEILNDESGFLEKPLETILNTLAEENNTYVGFKAFPEQIYKHGLHFGQLLDAMGVSHVVVIWREDLLEGFASLSIALSTDIWYSTKKPQSIQVTNVDPKQFADHIQTMTMDWEKIGSEWPINVRPIFVKFEDLIATPFQEAKRVLAQLSLNSELTAFVTPSERQNPSPLPEKVSNYWELEPALRDSRLDVSKILQEKIQISLRVSPEIQHLVPDREPCMPAGGWQYRVAEPFLPPIAKQNALDALHSGSISSAGHWPKEMAKRLRTLFRVPVAQPCSHGYTALLLAMQVCDVGPGDEVILPTMTMIAVANAVHYLHATPKFADNSAERAYNPSWKEIESLATSRTKVVVVTHTYGVPASDIETIARECQARGWMLIEDISECVGISCLNSQGQPQLLGTFGDFAVASLYANKMVHGGDGGFVVAKDAKFAKRLASIVNHGFTPSFHFVHFEPAPNAKIHGIGAAIAAGVLDELPYILEHRSQLAKWYRTFLADIPIKLMPTCGPNDTPWIFGLECQSKQQRTELRAFLAEHGVETRDYFFALHLQPAYREKSSEKVSCPNAELLGSIGFYLPTHTNLREQDALYICNVINLFFSLPQAQPVVLPFRRKFTETVQISPYDFSVEVRRYDKNGELFSSSCRNHAYIRLVTLALTAERLLISEPYDQVRSLIDSMQDEIKKLKGDPMEKSVSKYFSKFIAYFDNHVLEQRLGRPWLHVDLTFTQYHVSHKIPTTTDKETLQLLAWLVAQRKPAIIWELGCWMGHATALMAQASQGATKIFAMDGFRWQHWMSEYLPPNEIDEMRKENRKSFVPFFQKNLASLGERIQAVKWPYYMTVLPEVLKENSPQLIFMDFTQEEEDVEQIWNIIYPKLIPNETVLVFNGVTTSCISFFVKHQSELKALAKPYTIAKAFLFVGQPETESAELDASAEDSIGPALLPRRLKFSMGTSWDHHHDNLYNKAIQVLAEDFHDDNAEIVFAPAVEENMCDEPEIFYQKPWVGIIHSVVCSPERYYVPDLERLCTRPKRLGALMNCKGLFTLTEHQARYLRANLPESVPKFPIQMLQYPTALPEKAEESQVGQLIKQGKTVDVLHIGSFARDFDLFFKAKLPAGYRKVLVAGDESAQMAAESASTDDVQVIGRLSATEYEERLRSSVIFMTFKYDGAASTLVLECIARNVPILAPKLDTCLEYLGEGYPLLYDASQDMTSQLETLLRPENLERAMLYLRSMDKSKFSYETFVDNVRNGAVIMSLPPFEASQKSFDLTICMTSYKRTHNLSQILGRLWNRQDYKGSYEIVVWNNNECRKQIVEGQVKKYIESSTSRKSLQVIHSSENHYCAVRFAMPSLMKGKCLLICDDDVFPESNFLSFFHSAHLQNPEDVLCVRGHEFLPHELNTNFPRRLWTDYEHLRFRDDFQPEQLIHFVHADACLIPKQALREVSSVEMPDPNFALVDDQWMSYVLSHKFGRKLRKLCTATAKPLVRSDDSDTKGLALHTRPEVQDARLRMYIHHMLQGWPTWPSAEQTESSQLSETQVTALRNSKLQFLENTSGIGWNICSVINDNDLNDLKKLGTKVVRIGAVGVGGDFYYEFSGFLSNPTAEMERLEKLVEKLGKLNICAVITLERRTASPQVWQLIAQALAKYSNVVGYDLINEPYTPYESVMHWTQLSKNSKDEGLAELTARYTEIIRVIRKADRATPIVLEPTFWGQHMALPQFPVKELQQVDDNLVVSIHFYEPSLLTSRARNKGRFAFPGEVPWFDNISHSEKTKWNEETILKRIGEVKAWAQNHSIKVFVGEFGICRNVKGAPEYLWAVVKACKEHGLLGFLFSFRDYDWEAMDYELGGKYFSEWGRNWDEDKNSFAKVVKEISQE